MRLRAATISTGFAAALGALLSMAPTAVWADQMAFTVGTINSPSNYQAGMPVNLGMVFSISSSMTVDALGFYRDPLLTGSEDVGLFNSSGTLLTSATVSLVDPLSGGYLFHSISPLVLLAGTYTVAAQVHNNPWDFGTVGTAPGVTFLKNTYLYGNTLQYPTNAGGSGPAYLGPNLLFATATAVPEPITLSLFGAGLAGAALMRRRKAKKA